MNRNSRVGIGAVFPAALAALQWRLMLLWLIGVLLPTAVVALPIWQFLGGQLDMSVHAAKFASQFDPVMFADLLGATRGSRGLIATSTLLGFAMALLLSPLLTGFTITAIRSGRRLRFGELIHGGVSEYGKLFRLLLLAILPLGIALALGVLVTNFAGRNADTAIVAGSLARGSNIAFALSVALLVIAHAMVEAGRAHFAADASLHSAWRATWRGMKLVLRRPLAMLGSYGLIAIVGLAVAAAFGIWRINVVPTTVGGLLAAFAITQCIALALAWMRSTRLFAYAQIIRRG